MTARPIDTGTPYLLGSVDDRVAVLSMNQPERRNALHEEMYEGFARALPAVALDPSVGCLVVTGEGGAFCAGGDVKSFNENNQRGPAPDDPSFEERVDDLHRRERMLSLGLHEFPKVTIAAIPGAAAGAGLSIALACDLRIATERAILTTAFARIGASGDFGGSWFLTRLVGPSKALELYLTCERLDAERAEGMGLVNRVVADSDFDAAWRAWAHSFAHGPTLAHRYIKQNIHRALVADLDTCLAGEATAMVTTMRSADHVEAAAAFVEKRDAVYRGA